MDRLSRFIIYCSLLTVKRAAASIISRYGFLEREDRRLLRKIECLGATLLRWTRPSYLNSLTNAPGDLGRNSDLTVRLPMAKTTPINLRLRARG